MKLQTELAPQHKSGLLLKNPVLMAAGTFGYGIENAKIAEVQRLGAVISKGTTLRSRKGNEQPRTVETSAGMLNAIGLQNPGVHTIIAKYAPIWAGWDTPVIVNIAGEDIEEFVSIAEQLEGIAGVAAIEVNVSCPNVRAGGVVFGADPQAITDVTSALRIATTLPLIVKLSPNVTDIAAIAREAPAAGADGLAVTNTVRAPNLPDLPTVAEQGLPGFEATSWFGLVAPSHIPDATKARLIDAVGKALTSPDLAARLHDLGAEPGTAFGKDFSAFMDAEARKWGEVVRISGAKAE